MQLGIICVGKMKAGTERDLLNRYCDRIAKSAHQMGMTWAGITEIAESRASDPKNRKSQEAQAILAQIKTDRTALIVLDEVGRDMPSNDWATKIAHFRDNGFSKCLLLIGGADGHDKSLRSRADLTVSFGKQTMPHQLVRIIAAEQLYRVITILIGHPYHRQ
ncbi:MAG: 23S rRNA (pseudouridine(1915)-N(3))-methyltransferase RlmH [Pseudomonadota bacterium]